MDSYVHNLTVLLGAHELYNDNEIGRKIVAVESFSFHEKFTGSIEPFTYDVAVLKLQEDVNFNKYIYPVCIPKQFDKFEMIKNGIIIGYKDNITAYRPENEPILFKNPIHDTDKCIRKFPDLLGMLSNNTFCGGNANGIGLCGSGGGVGMTILVDGVHFLRGILVGALPDYMNICNLFAYQVFTDIKFFTSFIIDA